jgi:hypothetical protein
MRTRWTLGLVAGLSGVLFAQAPDTPIPPVSKSKLPSLLDDPWQASAPSKPGQVVPAAPTDPNLRSASDEGWNLAGSRSKRGTKWGLIPASTVISSENQPAAKNSARKASAVAGKTPAAPSAMPKAPASEAVPLVAGSESTEAPAKPASVSKVTAPAIPAPATTAVAAPAAPATAVGSSEVPPPPPIGASLLSQFSASRESAAVGFDRKGETQVHPTSLPASTPVPPGGVERVRYRPPAVGDQLVLAGPAKPVDGWDPADLAARLIGPTIESDRTRALRVLAAEPHLVRHPVVIQGLTRILLTDYRIEHRRSALTLLANNLGRTPETLELVRTAMTFDSELVIRQDAEKLWRSWTKPPALPQSSHQQRDTARTPGGSSPVSGARHDGTGR